MAKSIKKLGPAVISESGEYDSIKSMGPLTINAPAVTAESVNAMGPASINSTLDVQEMKINGPLTGSGKGTFGNLNVNGPVKFEGEFVFNESGKINGPIQLDGNLTGNSEAVLKINGPLESISVTDFKKVKINGPIKTTKLTHIATLKINGKVETDEIEVSEELIISLKSGESIIKKVTGGRIEIGQKTESSNFFKNFFSKMGKPGTAVIDEIYSNGTVELDNVSVKKVVARELFAGENTEIGEYVEIQD
jgi:cytoskeletal protein CcmA (bactofilin family)